MSGPEELRSRRLPDSAPVASSDAMSMTLQQIMSEARQLPREEISQLLDLLLAESFTQPDPEVEAEWRTETRRRIAEIESGTVQGIPGEQVMAELRQIIVR